MKRALGVAMAFTLLAGCSALDAPTVKLFITTEAKVVFKPPPREKGENIIEIENDDDVRHRPVLVRLDDGVGPGDLNVGPDGTVPVGKPTDLEFRGRGYRVVEKLDPMRAYFGAGPWIRSVVHVHLDNGRYVLFCNLPGHYRKGERASFTVGS